MIVGVRLAAQSAVDTYYSTVNASNSSFVTDLETRIRSPYTQVSYDNYKTTIIPNYEARDTTGGQMVVTCVYSGQNYVYTPPFAWGTFSREHTWCQSWFPSGGSTSSNEGSDQHHLFPTNQNSANGVRSNHPLGVVTSVTSSFLEGKYGLNASGYYVYEPRNSHKGDAARALLYMAVRYNGVNGYDWTFNNLNNTILPGLSEGAEDLATLIAWHLADPPDKWEVGRNDYIQSVQGNRNPFVDHPEWVNYINFNTLTKQSPSYSTEPTNQPTNLLLSAASSTSLTVSWTSSVTGSQAPSGYLIEIYNSNDYFIPIDGSSYSDDTNVSDSKGLINISEGTATYTFTGLTSATTYYVRMYPYNGTGTSINYKIDGTVLSSSASTSGSSPLSTEPTNYPTGFALSNVTSNAIQLDWTDAAAGSQTPSAYLIIASTSSSITNPTDGVAYSNDTDLSDGFGEVNIDYSAANTYTFSGLRSNTRYYFQIYSYYGTSTSINYKTDGTIPSANDSTLSASSSLAAGDILIIGFNMTDPDEFAFVPMTAIPAGTTIHFTDNGWLSTGSFRNNEGVLTWTAPGGGVTAGTIVDVTSTSTVSVGSIAVASGTFSLATGGDQILAYTGADISPTFLYGVNDSGSTWQASAYSSNSSGLPTGLTNGSTAVAITKVNNAVYSGPITSDAAQMKLNVSTASNWSGSSTRLAMPSGSWSILPVELVDFTARSTKEGVHLYWNTATELNNYGFEIERKKSDDVAAIGSNWKKIAFINGNGTSNSTKEYSYIDKRVMPGKYSYRLRQIDNDGSFTLSKVIELSLGTPIKYLLHQNYPNPFNPSTTIVYEVPNMEFVSLKVHDILGNEICTLVNEVKDAGAYTVVLNSQDSKVSHHMPSGIYYYTLRVGEYSDTKKMVLIK